MPEKPEPIVEEALPLPALAQVSERASRKLAQVRKRMLDPEATKKPPTFTLSRLAELCRLNKETLRGKVVKVTEERATDGAAEGGLPLGRMEGNRLEFELAEAQRWVRHTRAKALRPAGAEGVLITVANFKGGSTKSTTAMTLAQGLTLLGHRVLAIDLDPQGTLTTFFGILPAAEIDPDDTALMMCTRDDESPDLSDLVRNTYWAGLDLIPGCPGMNGAEFMLPATWMRDRRHPFWDRLSLGVKRLRKQYDVIIVDTPPSLGYLTINALYAADGLLIPVPPKPMDFASLAQFWTLFTEVFDGIERGSLAAGQPPKVFDFVKVLLSKVETTDSATDGVREWLLATYTNMVLPVEIPQTTVASASSAKFGTVYDVQRYPGNRETYLRAKLAYDRMGELLEQTIQRSWASQLDRNALEVRSLSAPATEAANG